MIDLSLFVQVNLNVNPLQLSEIYPSSSFEDSEQKQ